MENLSSSRKPVCGFVHEHADGTINTCAERGDHYCKPRADRVVAFFAEVLVHTKSVWARRAFTLEDWQENDIIRPLFGTAVWSPEWKRYIRRYRIAYVILGRKNGKTELAAGVVLYLLVGDDEESAEVYGAAKDTKQAGKVSEVVVRMRELSPPLRKRIIWNKNNRRMSDETTASYYEVITADAAGELGHNPHGVIIDELLTQPDGSLFHALRTAMGTRSQPLMLVISTETDDPDGFAAAQIDEAERVAAEPERAPHVFAYIRKTPMDADPFDERNWHHANPALGSFLSIQSLRDEAIEARNEPARENPFRQYRLNQRVQQVSRWMPLHLWDASAGMVVETSLAGEECFAGLDLASTTDLAAWVLLFPPSGASDCYRVLWRFWTPEAQIPYLDRHTAGQASVWVRQGLLLATEGDWIDFEAIHRQMEADAASFRIRRMGYDPYASPSTVQHAQRIGLDVESIYQGHSLSPALKEIMRLTKAGLLEHGGHPVARWNADSAEVRQDDQERIKLVKPKRNSSGKRVDGMAALADAFRIMQLTVEEANTGGGWMVSVS